MVRKKGKQEMSKLTKDKKGGAFALILIIILIVAAVFIIPTIASGEPVTLDSIWNWLKNLIGQTNSSGIVGIGFTVHFKDGSSENFGASPTLTISPLSVSVLGKEFNSIDVFVRAKMTAEDVGQWSAEVTQKIELYKKPSLSPEYFSTGFFSETGTSWISGALKNLAVTPLDADVINDLVASHGAGDWFMQVIVAVDLEAELDGVNTTFEGIAPSAGIDFTYTNESYDPAMSITTEAAPIS